MPSNAPGSGNSGTETMVPPRPLDVQENLTHAVVAASRLKSPPRTMAAWLPKRDVAIDILRGWAIVLMILSHVGSTTYLSTLAHLPRYFTAADCFVLLSGLTLGMVSRRRVEEGALGTANRRLLHRARTLWLIHCGLMVFVIAVHETTSLLREVPSLASAGGLLNVAWKIPALRLQSNDLMNILPLYIMFLVLSPVALWFLSARKPLWLLLLSGLPYVAAQIWPYAGRWTDPACGHQVFSLMAWQFAFFLALSIGYYRPEISRDLWPRHRRWLAPTMFGVFAVVFVVAQLQRPTLARLGMALPPGTESFFVGKETCKFGQLSYCLLFLGVAYLVVRAYLRRTGGAMGRGLTALATVGRYSLYCFLAHLTFGLTARALSGVHIPDPILEVWDLVAIACVYLLAKHQVLAKYIPN